MSTYVPIQAITLSAAASSVTFSGIPQTYTDLVLVIQGFNTTNAAAAKIQFNADTGSNYSTTWLEGASSAASSGRESNQTSIFIYYNGGASTNGISTAIANINNYSNTVTNKTVVTRFGNITQTGSYVGLWRNTSAITSLVVNAITQNFQANSTFTLYGIGSGAPKAFGGSEVRTDGTYWYHIFRSSGQFTPVQALTVDYLVVAGGGGGGGGNSGNGEGGGGAGGMRCTVTGTGGSGALETPLNVIQGTAYTVTVGGGGAAENKGTNSTFSTITSDGGGTRAAGLLNGGSGAGQSGGAGAGPGTGISTQGFAGGTTTAGTAGGAGGGGASQVGNNATGASGANGGNGRATSISGSSVTYAGGGGGSAQTASGGTGGTGGTGGGGNGAPASGNATNGTANLGGGGGAARIGAGQTAGQGGSGIVIVRYAV